MKLGRVEITGFKSIKETISLFLDNRVTVILGANDHGKTNILEAITHLNLGNPFTEEDVNWDMAGEKSELPKAVYWFDLDDDERTEVLARWQVAFDTNETRLNESKDPFEELLEALGEDPTDESIHDLGEDPTEEQENEPETDEPDETGPNSAEQIGRSSHEPGQNGGPGLKPNFIRVPAKISLSRIGVASEIEWTAWEPDFSDDLLADTITVMLDGLFPRVELIAPFQSLNDSVGPEEIDQDANEFMQGIFYTAEIDPMDSQPLFVQDDRTTRTLDEASEILHRELRESWAQGRDSGLQFKLDHRSGRIDLLLRDPAVRSQYVRASRRSSGFTHFFTMSMVLHARKNKNPAGTYIWLFDEPGVFLHASGQRDLLQVLESLSGSSQIVYTTHSLFMINRNFPSRHRLVHKDSNGTRMDGKPYVAQWKATLDQLGLSLPGTILFAPKVLLTEGDADPIYVHALLQYLIQIGKCEFDINGFSALATGNSKHANVFIELLTSNGADCQVALLFDGDKGGKDRIGQLKSTMDNKGLKYKVLTSGTSIEDHLPMVRTLYVTALINYLEKLENIKPAGSRVDAPDFVEKIRQSFNKHFPDPGKEKNVAGWASGVGEDLFQLPKDPSKVGIAREYVDLLLGYSGLDADHDSSVSQFTRAVALSKWIGTELGLPPRIADSQRVLDP